MGANPSTPSLLLGPSRESGHSSSSSVSGVSGFYARGANTGGRHYNLYSSSSTGVVDDLQHDLARSSTTSGHGSSNSSSGVLMRSIDDTTRKKKISKFATLRKKLTRVRRHSRSTDHGRAIRELTSTWTVRELHAMSDEYEASAALKELTSLACAARPAANTVMDDLALLYQNKYCTDIDLVYLETVFPAHRAILCVRCPYFRELLARHPEFGARVPVEVRTPGVDVSMFSALLRYLYTGDFGLDETQMRTLRKLLNALAHEFGAPNSLEQDLRTLFDTAAYADAVLVFSPASDSSDYASTRENPIGACSGSTTPHMARVDFGGSGNGGGGGGGAHGIGCRSRSELRCHKALLAARSPFFRNLILRRARAGDELAERACDMPTYIVLDESVIPRRYARALLTALYLDSVDTTSIMRSSVSLGTLSEVQAIVGSGRTTHWTTTDEAMELYHIGKFLEFPALANGCEDIIAEALTIENLPRVLHWSTKPFGSAWVHRQAVHFLREEFIQIAHHPVLYELGREYLVEAISSDFLQASELEVLSAVIKWSEHQLVKRIEDREPNLLTNTAHSISRKGVKKRDMNDVELREILVDLLPHVRTDHVIPPDSEVLTGAIKRGLISVPPSHMLGSDTASATVTGRSSASAWVRTRNTALFVRPRLFTPYYDEIKALLKEQTARGQDNSAIQVRVMHTCAIPDALYMLEDRTCPLQLHQQHQAARQQRQQQQQRASMSSSTMSSSTVDVIAGIIPVPNNDVIESMCQRESELLRSKLVQRACALLCTDRSQITTQVQLRVVREFGLPDSAVEVLQSVAASAALNSDFQHPPAICQDVVGAASASVGLGGLRGLSRTSQHIYGGFSGSMSGSQNWQQIPLLASQHRRRCHMETVTGRRSPLILAPMMPCVLVQDESSDISGSSPADSPTLRSAMPDIAMATASIGRMSVQPHINVDVDNRATSNDVVEPIAMPVPLLDLGDGTNHSTMGNNPAVPRLW